MEMPDLVDVMTTPTCCISIRIRLKRSGFEALCRANSCRRHLKNHPIAITLITASNSTSHLRGLSAQPPPGPPWEGRTASGFQDLAITFPSCVAALCRHHAALPRYAATAL